ncbi:MAG: SpoIIE family protein phosphatase [Clostridia bacterium]|nr:SpoIIE family protein phosphatase [Clostridia bacterium]
MFGLDSVAESGIELIIAAADPILLSALFAWMLKKTRFGTMRPVLQQLIMGLAFGAAAVVATELSIPIGGASINVRDAAPLAAGMLFGAPSGIIAGIIGGVERWYAAGWGAGMFTREACASAAIFAGIIGGVLHHWFFTRQRPAWWYAVSAALCVEVLHMLLIFLTNMRELETAFSVVETCTVPMIASNCVSVLGCSVVVRSIDGQSRKSRLQKLEYVLQRSLFFSVLVAMIVSGLFVWVLEESLIVEKTRSLLEVHLEDVPRGVHSMLDSVLVGYTDFLADSMMERENGHISGLPTVVRDTVAEAYVIDPESGDVLFSADETLQGGKLPVDWREAFDYSPGTGGYSTVYGPSFATDDPVKYAMIFLNDGHALIIGFRADFVRQELRRQIEFVAADRHVGETGYIIMVGEDGHLDSSNGDMTGSLESLGFSLSGPPNTILMNSNGPEPTYYMYDRMDNRSGSSYIVIAAVPVAEASFVSNLAMYVTIFLEILVFAVLFMELSALVRREMVRKLDAVNLSLAVLTEGNLDEVVNVRSTEEFAQLSDGINATVDTLKRYSAQIQERHDRELEFARTIQRASLPSVFPPFPSRVDFEIYASMDAAKVVGGDFYDFYLLNDRTLAFLIADVSGKGVPAAMFMMRAKTKIKDLIETGMDVADVFTRTNWDLYENNAANMFVTAWMGVLNLTTGQLRFVNAGHTPPLLMQYGGEFRYLETDADFVLGGLDGITYTAGELWMRPGDTIYIYTDGVTEAENAEQEQYGEERLLKSLQGSAGESLEEVCGRVLKDVESFAGDVEQFDDITMLAVRLNAMMNLTSVELRPDAPSEAVALHFARLRLEELRVPPKVTDEVLSEIARIWQRVMHTDCTQVVLSIRREEEGLYVSFYNDGSEGSLPLAAGGENFASHDQEGGQNVLELHWPLDAPLPPANGKDGKNQ